MFKSKLLASALGSTGLAAAAVLAMALTTATPASAGVCPALTDHVGAGGASDCTDLLTINPDGSVTQTNPAGVANYDASEDSYVGILNNTGSTLNHFFLTSTLDIFGFDADGICETSRFSGADCGGTAAATVNTTNDYAPNGVTFTILDLNNGFVDFAGGLAPGQSGYFSLEENVGLTGLTLKTSSAPEPMSLAILGAGLAGGAFARRRRNKA